MTAVARKSAATPRRRKSADIVSISSAPSLSGSRIKFAYDSLDEAFPTVDSGHEPLGSLVLVQIRLAKEITSGGIIVLANDRQTEHDNTQVAKVVAVGPLAFRNRTTMDPWPEGAWAKPGDYVRIAKYNGDRWNVEFDRVSMVGQERVTAKEAVEFVLLKDLDLRARIKDPMAVKAYL